MPAHAMPLMARPFHIELEPIFLRLTQQEFLSF